ncbi:HNH endonuclease [Phreatobacter oligotrophus]|uniref:Putative restriction endonuclease n=1 Tax=Phreatobacter oligotrophus TaxID=1122261 RepID=A0A2T4YY80_9HYPH|nr:HNH endonuclease [Phreatobacter oligotrophus]PTM51462.1 putative restriction endonuclease [Phreatobacter oligotrophus]
MSVKLIVAVTDGDWFEHLRRKPDLAEVNFWAPAAANFKALEPGELFLFKLHAPRNMIVGGGVFAYANALPCSLAWEAFGEANGASSLGQMRTRIAKYRKADPADRSDFTIGCRILTQPFFLPESRWIPVPESWAPNIVSFKGYSTSEPDGLRLWEAVQSGMAAHAHTGFAEEQARYGEPTLVRPRLGQGAFRILVTDSYHRKCAISGEKTLPALDAAHIRPFADGGTHEASNGVLMRRDIHSLFDAGYVTITPELRFEVSPRIREEFSNGRQYYELHGQTIAVPDNPRLQPDRSALRWHNDETFRA